MGIGDSQERKESFGISQQLVKKVLLKNSENVLD